MKRQGFVFLSFVLLSCFILFLEGSPAAEIRLGVPVPEETREYTLLLEQTERIKTQTQGRIDIQLRFMKEKQMGFGEMVKQGQLDGCLSIETDFPVLGLGQESLVYSIPFLFSNRDDVAALGSKLDALLLEKMGNDEVKALDFVDFGFMYFGSSTNMASPDSWGKQVFWLPGSDAFVVHRLKTTPLQFSTLKFKYVLNALKNDEIQGVLSPLPLVIMKRWHTRLKFFYQSPVVYSYGIWTVDRHLLDGLNEADCKELYASLDRLGKTLEKTLQQRHESSLKVLERYGATFIAPVPALSVKHYNWLQNWLPEVQQELNLSAEVMQHLANYVNGRKPGKTSVSHDPKR